MGHKKIFLGKNKKMLDDMILIEAQTGSKKTLNLIAKFEEASAKVEAALENPAKIIEVKVANEVKILGLKELKILKLQAKDNIQKYMNNFNSNIAVKNCA